MASTELPAVDPDEIDRILAEGATLPGSFYTDPRIATLEDEAVFRRTWQIVGVEPEVRRPGDFFTSHISGTNFSVPIVVTRADDGRLRAFVNVCRHRAHFVAVGCGHKKFLQCSYHGWTYKLDGSLNSVPRSDEGGLPPFDRLGLYDLPVDTWRGYVFVALQPAEPLSAAVTGLGTVLDDVGFDFPFAAENADPDFEYVRQVQPMSGPSNWKAMNENNIECYHCPTTHRHSFSDMYKVDPAHYLHREFDRGVYHTSDFQDRVAATLGLTERGGAPEYQFYYLWPNMYLQGGIELGFGGTVERLWPDGVDRWKGEIVSYALPSSREYDPDVIKQVEEWWRLTVEEDRDAAGRVQTGLKSGLYSWGYTLPESERNMRHFYRLVWEALAPSFRH